MNIAFFDSGIGGLTVLSEAKKVMPYESYIYFADTDNVPYGTKTSQDIFDLVEDAVKYLSMFELKALVLACNTATSVAVSELRKRYDFPIIGMEPAIKPATSKSEKKILVCATDRTLKEGKLNILIDNLNANDRVLKCSLQELVTYAENFDFHNNHLVDYFQKKFSNIDWNEFDSIVLGCTHFLFFKPLLTSIVPNHISIVDGNKGTVNRLQSLVKIDTQQTSVKPIQFYQSKRKIPQINFDHYLRFIHELDM